MSVIFVLVGQCGNQLGEEVLSQLFEGTNFGKDPSAFFTKDGKARCVLVDSEPKAIEGVLLRSEERFGKLTSQTATIGYNPIADGGIFRRESIATGESGRGNCWGLGYNGLQERIPAREEAFKQAKNQRRKDDYLLQRALCAIHAESCRVDEGGFGGNDGRGLEAIIVIHSLAGGTGSGFTSKLVEKLDLYFQKRTCHTIGSNDDDMRATTATKRTTAGGGGRGAGSRHAAASSSTFRSKYDELDAEDEQARLRSNPNLMGKIVSEDEFRYYQQQEDKHRDADGLDAVYGTRKRASFILSVSVSPMKIGENAVQGINGVLTLHSLLKSVHAVILLRNDDALHNMPQPLSINTASSSSASGGTSSATTTTGRTTLRQAAASATSGTAYHAPQSMHEINAVFAAQLAVVFHFGTQFGVVGDLMRRVCPLNPTQQSLSDTGNRNGWSKIISLVPLPQRAFSRFGHSCYLSSVYRLPTDMFGTYLVSDYNAGFLSGAAVVPLEQIHMQCKQPMTRDRNAVRATLPDAATSDVRVIVPKSIFQHVASGAIARPFQVWPIMALNQLEEVNDNVLFPLLSDAHGKVTEKAFVHTFEATGVSSDYIELCLRRVAHHLCGQWDMGMGSEGRGM